MNIAVLVPSFKRAFDLRRCLSAIASQTRAADSVMVVTRHGDIETLAALNEWRFQLPLKVVQVREAGVVNAINAGLAQCATDIVAMTDDDAAPRQDWLEQIAAHFQYDEKLGGIGGRDWVHQNGRVEDGMRIHVGLVRWYGRIIGNHHLGTGIAREVDVVKGANCAFRLVAVRPYGLENRLRGQGAQVHWEMCLCFAIKNAGWRLIYDPAIAVDHYPSQRFDIDQRDTFHREATFDRAYNRRLACQLITPTWRRVAVLVWDVLIGTRDEPGLTAMFRGLLRGDKFALQRYKVTVSAYWAKHVSQPREV